MNKNYELLDRAVEIFTDGGWQFSGIVEFISPEILVLNIQNKSQVIYRDKIVAALILDNKNIEQNIDHEETNEYLVKNVQPSYENDIIGGYEIGNTYGSIIPEDMLEKTDEKISPIDFSIQMSKLQQLESKVGEKSGPRKEDKTNRKKPTK